MSDLFLLSRVQMRRIEPFFPRSRGLPRVDDRRVISGIVLSGVRSYETDSGGWAKEDFWLIVTVKE